MRLLKMSLLATLLSFSGTLRAADAEGNVPPVEESEAVPIDAAVPGESSPPAEAAPFEAPDPARTVVTGWFSNRTSFSRPADPPSGPVDLRVPHDWLVNEATFYLQLSHRPDRGTAFVVSSALAHRARVRDSDRPVSPPERANYDFRADLLEAYVGLYRGVVDVTLGQQRIAWGRNELFGVNDVVNSRDLRDPLLIPEELRYRPTPAARVDLTYEDISLQLAWMPFFVPHRFEFYGTNWSIVQDDAPAELRAVLNQTAGSAQAGSLFALNSTPADLSLSQASARFGWKLQDVELNTYYRYGPDPTPLWSYDPQLLVQLLDPTLQGDPASQTLAFAAFANSVRTSYVRAHHLGASVVAPIGTFVLYAEGAHETTHVFITPERMSLSRPMTAAVAGVEYQRDLDQVVDLAFQYVRVHQLPEARSLLGYERDNVASALSARWALGSDFALQVRGIVSMVPWSLSGRLGAIYSRNHLSFAAGVQALSGSEYSFGGTFRANTGLYLDLRYVL